MGVTFEGKMSINTITIVQWYERILSHWEPTPCMAGAASGLTTC